MVAIEVGVKNRGAMVVVAAVQDRRILLRVGAGAVVDVDARDGGGWPIARAVDEVEVAVVVDIERGEGTHLIAASNAGIGLEGEAGQRLRAGGVRVVGGSVAGVQIKRGGIAAMCIGRPGAVCLQDDEVWFAVIVRIGHAELRIFPGRLDEVGFAGEERRGGL